MPNAFNSYEHLWEVVALLFHFINEETDTGGFRKELAQDHTNNTDVVSL